jgi:hypothetical protein
MQAGQASRMRMEPGMAGPRQRGNFLLSPHRRLLSPRTKQDVYPDLVALSPAGTNCVYFNVLI